MRSVLVASCLLAGLLLSACGGGSASLDGSESPSSKSATPIVSITHASETVMVSAGPTMTFAAGTDYTVQPGDTLYGIGQKFGVDVGVIRAANGISGNMIVPGQVLHIPGGSPQATEPATPPPGGALAQVIRYGNKSRKMVAFTFDAGSDRGYGQTILDTLKANGLHASFGMTGQWAERNPDLLHRMVDEGHSLINHTYHHYSFTGSSNASHAVLTRQGRWDELDRTERIVNELTGATTKPFFRPPYGDSNDSVNADVGADGYSYSVMWSVDSKGWQGISAPEIEDHCLSAAEPGAIYVFHVGAASQDGPALQSIIDGLRAAGYDIGTVPDVLAP